MILLEEHKPLITDWFIACGALAGIPLAFWGIITLFIRDRNKERHLTALENMSNSQSQILNKMQEQIEELSKQTAQFQYQSYMMGEANKLFEKQIEVQITQFEHTKTINIKKAELDDLKRRESIKPYLIIDEAPSGPQGFSIDILNKGQDAFNLKLVPVNFDFISPIGFPPNANLKGKELVKLFGHIDPYKTSYSNNQVPFEGQIEYFDVDGNYYQQNIKRESNGRVTIGDPIFLQDQKTADR